MFHGKLQRNRRRSKIYLKISQQCDNTDLEPVVQSITSHSEDFSEEFVKNQREE